MTRAARALAALSSVVMTWPVPLSLTAAARCRVEIPNELPNSTTVAGFTARTRAYSSRPPAAETGM